MIRRVSHTFLHGILLLSEFTIYKLRIISPTRFGQKLALRIEKMGGIYCKVGQLLSVRPDIISFPIAHQLYPLLQQLKPVPFDYISKVLQQELPQTFRDQIKYIDPVPLATGSIAQVHKVILHNNEWLAVKIIKPGIKQHLRIDLRSFHFFMKIGARLPGIKKMPVRELANELDNMIREQLDLQTEARSLREFQENFRDNPDVIIPDLIPGIDSAECILLQFLELPAEQPFGQWPQEKRTDVARKALSLLYQMMFRDGFTHCDMHPGNFFVTPEGKFILLDFGMTNRMTPEFRSEFIRFFFYMSVNNGNACAAIIEKTALGKSKHFNRDFFYEEVRQFIAAFSSLTAQEFSVLAFTKRLIQVEKKCGIKGSTSFINNILAIAFFESHLKRIDPTIDFQEEAAQYIMRKVPAAEQVFEGM